MSEETSPFNLILFLNSFLIIGLILNQNESTKDSVKTQNQSSSSNPFETLTWICLMVQIILLIIKVKINNS